MDKTRWIIFSVIAVGILALLVFLSGGSRVDVADVDHAKIQAPSEQSGQIGDQIRGNPDAKVILIEYSDPQCPGCASANPRIKELVEDYGDQIAFVYRHWLITSIHPNAKASAATIEAAGLQGSFWEMLDKVFELQTDWQNLSGTERTDRFVSYAQELNLDTERFKEDMASDAVNKKLSFDQALGNQVNVNSTPTFFLNGKMLDQSVWGDDTEFRKAIDAELAKYND